MKNTFTKFAGVAVVALALVQTLQAAPIVGNIGFTGRTQFDTANAGTATQVISWVNPTVNGTTGDFTGLANGTPVNFATLWSFNTVAPINPFWSVGGFTFTLLSSSITFQNANAVFVDGTGIVSGNDFEATALNWSFSSQNPNVTTSPSTFTFSASSASLPDGGATVALLGLALSGVGLLRKKLTA